MVSKRKQNVAVKLIERDPTFVGVSAAAVVNAGILARKWSSRVNSVLIAETFFLLKVQPMCILGIPLGAAHFESMLGLHGKCRGKRRAMA